MTTRLRDAGAAGGVARGVRRRQADGQEALVGSDARRMTEAAARCWSQPVDEARWPISIVPHHYFDIMNSTEFMSP